MLGYLEKTAKIYSDLPQARKPDARSLTPDA